MKRMDKIRSFEVLACSGEIPSEFISTNKAIRERQYNDFKDEGIILYPYKDIRRKHLLKRDLIVFNDEWWIIFRYLDVVYKLTIHKGAIQDGASIPLFARWFNTTAHNQYVSIPAAMHDCFFALHLFLFDDSNNIFSGALRYKKLNKFGIGKLMLGVRSSIGHRSYRNNKPEEHWLKDFVDFEIIHS